MRIVEKSGDIVRFRSVAAIAAVTIAAVGTSRADFKYTQQSKVTGGAMMGVTKTLGVFSKSARQINEPQLTTTMIHGNRLRTESSTGTVEIIDLDGRRFIHIDTTKKTYTVQTFDQLKQQLAQAQEKMKAEQAKAAAKHGDPQTMTMVPKFDMQATGASHPVLNLPAKEMKMRMDMLFKSTDPKTEADLEKSQMSTWMTSDAWYGTVPGYDELRDFYKKMAKELDWLPNSMGMGNPQMSAAAEEFKKNAVKMDGMPLLQYTSFGMSANGQAGQGSADQSAQQPPPPSTSNDSTPTSPSGAIAKSLGGLFGKKKQQQQADSNANASTASNPNNPPPPAAVPGSMMDMTIEVTSYSKDSLDAGLFDVPTGYAQIQVDASGK
jgi:hypothetical protein